MSKTTSSKLLAQALLAVSQVLFPLLIYPTVTRSLGPEGLGKVSFADSLVQTITVFASLGIPLYGIREIAIRRNDTGARSELFWNLFFLQLGVLVPAVIALWLLGAASGIEHHLLLLGTVALLGSGLAGDWFLQGSERFGFIALRSVVIRLLATFLIVILVNGKDDYLLYYAILCGSIVTTLLLNLSVITAASGFPRTPFRVYGYFKNIHLLYGCYVLASLYALLDTLLLGWLSTDEAVGYYSFGYRIVRMAAMLVPMLGVVFIPKIAFFHAADNQPEVKNQVYKSQEVLFFFSMPLCAFFFILAPEIMYVFASGSFQVTITVIRILSPVPLLAGLSHLAGSQVLLPIKQEKIFFLILAAGCLLNVILDLALIPVLQEKGAAFANVSVEAFVAAGTCWYLYSRGLLHVAKKQLAVCFAVSLLLLPTVYFFRYLEAAPPVVLFLSVFVTGAVYVFVYFKTFPHTVIKELVPFWKRI